MRPTRNMAMGGKLFSAALLLFIALLCYSQPAYKKKTATQSGQPIFAANCSGCHGLDATGTQRAPNLVTNPQIQKLSRDELSRIISHGVPEKGMPAFQSLGSSAIASLASYIRSLQGKSQAMVLPGDPKAGEQVFFGRGECGNCHMAGGKGGFIGPDLTSYAQTRAPEKIKQAITDPAQREVKKVATVVSNERKYRGVILNEDNFSLQLQTLDGNFHFFSRADLKAVNREENSIMPSDYASRLSESQLNDLVSYLLSLSKNSVATNSAPEPGE